MNKRKLLEKYIRTNLDSAYRFAFSYTHNAYDAEDIVSASVVKALQNVSSLKNPESVRAWFFTIIVNTAKSHFAKSKKLIYFEDMEDSPSFCASAEDRIDVERLLNGLPAELREIIVLRFFEEFSLKEIAEIKNIPESTVKSKLYRALKKIRAEEWCEYE